MAVTKKKKNYSTHKKYKKLICVLIYRKRSLLTMGNMRNLEIWFVCVYIYIYIYVCVCVCACIYNIYYIYIWRKWKIMKIQKWLL